MKTIVEENFILFYTIIFTHAASDLWQLLSSCTSAKYLIGVGQIIWWSMSVQTCLISFSTMIKYILLHDHMEVRRKTHHWWRYSGDTTGNDPLSCSSIFQLLWLYSIDQSGCREFSWVMFMCFNMQSLNEIECMCQRITEKHQQIITQTVTAY